MRNLISLLILVSNLTAQYYVVSTVTGSGRQQLNFTGAIARNARLINPRGVTSDPAGNIYFSDSFYNQVLQVTPAGALNLIAGAGRQGSSGDGGAASAALLDNPVALAFDSASNLYIADQDNGRIRRVTPAGVISTFATLAGPTGLAFDSSGNLYASQASLHTIRRIAPDGTITVFAGTGTSGFAGDGAAATAARLFAPNGLKFDSSGNLFFADTSNHRIRRVTPAGVISTVAGDGVGRFTGDGGQALAASLSLPADVAFDSSGNLLIADGSTGRIRIVNAQGLISTLAGGSSSYNDGLASQARLPGITSIALDNRGDLLISVSTARQIRRLSQQVVSTVAGVLPSSSTDENIPALSSPLLSPLGLTFDSSGNLLVSDNVEHRVRRITPAGIAATLAGNGFFGFEGDGGQALAAQVGGPRGLAFDRNNNLWIVSGAGPTIRRITPAGLISTIAGNNLGFSGDGGPARTAAFLNPNGIAADAAGNIYIADTGNHRIRRIDTAALTISTFAGSGDPGFAGDDGRATQAQLTNPRFLTFDSAGNLYIADTGNNRIRRVTPGGIISTYAGNGSTGATGDGGPATSAALGVPTGIAFDASDTLYIATSNRIRKVDAPTRSIATIAGNNVVGFSGEGVLATAASLDSPQGVAVDASGAIFFVDQRNYLVRKLTPSRIVAEGVTNGATLKVGPVAPGEIISIFGFDLGPAAGAGLELNSSGRVSTQLAGTQVLFDGIPAPLLYVSPGQVNTVVPYAAAGSPTTRVQVVYQGRPTNTITLPVAAASPGLFAITNQDGSVNTASNPAARNSVLILYGTGEGQTAPAGVDGSVATSVFPKPILDVTVQIGGRPASVLYAGAAPGFVAGVMQINVSIPAGLTGTLPLQIKVGEASSPTGTNISVR